MKKTSIAVALLMALVLIIQSISVVLAAPPQDTPGNGPPQFEKMVFVHYPKDVAPGKPAGVPAVKPKKDKTTALYAYNKTHWPYTDAADGISWFYNASGESEDFYGAVQASFQTWDLAGTDIKFIDGGGTSAVPGEKDNINTVGWGDISAQYPSAIGVTTVWYYRYLGNEKIIVECDTILNTNAEYLWTWYGFTYDAIAYDVDVQNIMTHEAGHWLMLLDMYDDKASEQTMYGYAGQNEDKKISLESGDITGINTIYK